jgi:hypothetical protein
MVEGTINDVGHGFESAVRVPGSALGLSRSIVNLSHLIHVNKGIELLRRDSRKSPAYWKAFTLKSLRGYRS